MISELQKKLAKYNVNINESVLSMILGAIVVILIGVLAYGYFRNQRPLITTNPPAVENEETENGELATPAAAVKLPTLYTVSAGDTLWSIAEKFYASGHNYQDIAKANTISDPKAIEVGQKLTIPKVEIRQPLTAQKDLQPTVTPNKITGNSYTVVAGDYLWDIAVRAYNNGFRWTEISSANRLVNPDVIHAGNVFVIPRP